jgi:hypothetical protein
MISIIVFYVTLAAGVIFAFVISPVFSFVTYQVIYFFNPEKRWWGDFIPDLSYSFFSVVYIYIFVVLGRKYFSTNSILRSPPLCWANMLLLAYGAVYFVAFYQELHFEFFIFFIKLILIINFAYKLVQSNKDLAYILYGYIFGAWYISFYVFQVGRNSGNRVEGVGLVDSPDANGLAAAIAPSLVLCMYYFWMHKKKVIKLLFALAGIFIANALVLINSRGSFLGAASGVFFFILYMLFSATKTNKQRMMAVFIVVVGLSGALYIADEDFIARMTGIGDELEAKEEKQTGATRILFWEAAYQMSLDYPLGQGFKSFNYYSDHYIPEWVDTGPSRNRSVHSTWFQVLTELGYQGLIIFIIMIISAWRALGKVKAYCAKRDDPEGFFLAVALQGSFLTFLVTMSFINRMTAEILFWEILFAAAAYNHYVLKDVNQTEK